MNTKTSQSAGFTLIEMIIALALFASVSTVSIGALLVLIDSNRELRGEQELITNVSFTLDMMTRDIRSGYNYVCATLSRSQYTNRFMPDQFDVENWNPSGATDCSNGKIGDDNHLHIISFSSGSSLVAQEDQRIAFIYDPSVPTILRRIGNNEPQRIISSAIDLIEADIIVSGTTDDDQQPTTTFLLVVAGEDGATYEVQTTVTQRFLDI